MTSVVVHCGVIVVVVDYLWLLSEYFVAVAVSGCSYCVCVCVCVCVRVRVCVCVCVYSKYYTFK